MVSTFRTARAWGFLCRVTRSRYALSRERSVAGEREEREREREREGGGGGLN